MFFALIIVLRDRKSSSSVTFTSLTSTNISGELSFQVTVTKRQHVRSLYRKSNSNPLVESLSPKLAVKFQTEVAFLHPFLDCGLAPLHKDASHNIDSPLLCGSIHRAQFVTGFRNTHKPHVTIGITPSSAYFARNFFFLIIFCFFKVLYIRAGQR